MNLLNIQALQESWLVTTKLVNQHPIDTSIGAGLFTSCIAFVVCKFSPGKGTLALGCSCNYGKQKLCDHQAQVLYNIMERPDLRIFFDDRLRHQSIFSLKVTPFWKLLRF